MENLGSTLTIFGNPQMALMASKSNAFVDQHSRLELKTCVKYLWLPTLIVWSLNLISLLLYYHFNRCRISSKDEPPSNDIAIVEQVHQTNSIDRSTPVLLRYTRHWKSKPNESISLEIVPSIIDRSVSVASFASMGESMISFRPSDSRLFKIILFILLITVIILLFISNEKIYFDIGLIPVGAAIILLVVDTLINHQAPILILTRIDWNVLLLFFGLFVWLDGLNSTGIPHRIW